MSREKELEALYDTSEGWQNPRNSPHVWPQLVNGTVYYSARGAALVSRCAEYVPRRPYASEKTDFSSLVHWGQRKLLIAEIQFLLLHGHLADTVVYAGAAPGTHTAVLMRFFPNHRFYLYDPAPFNLDANENLVLRQQMFTDEVAASWAPGANEFGKPVLFVCDIRSADFDLMGGEEFAKHVVKDMAAQKRWCELMQPAMASLKFRLPWDPGFTSYLAGDIYFQIWGPPRSIETRLFTNCRAEQPYDNQQYDTQCYYYNTVVRLAMHNHGIEGVPGMDNCGDCAGEAYVLAQYVERFGALDCEGVGGLMNMITSSIRGGRTLADVVDFGEQKQRVIRNQWVQGKPAYIAPE